MGVDVGVGRPCWSRGFWKFGLEVGFLGGNVPKNGRKLTAYLRSCYGNVDAAVHEFVRRQMVVGFVL